MRHKKDFKKERRSSIPVGGRDGEVGGTDLEKGSLHRQKPARESTL